MLDYRTIEKIADRVAKQKVAEAGLERILAESVTDSEGNDALRITLVLKPKAVEALTGDAALDLLVELQRALAKEGEERFPIIEYATEQELAEDEQEEEPEPDEDDT
jgi:hypothetical protein